MVNEQDHDDPTVLKSSDQVTTSRRRQVGRPALLTDMLRGELCALIRDGVSPEHAAHAVGIALSTYYRWMATGREAVEKTCRLTAEERRCRELYREVGRAKVELQQDALAHLRAAAGPQRRRKTTRKHVRLFRGGEVVRDDAGEPVVVESVVVEEIECSGDWRASEALLKRTDRVHSATSGISEMDTSARPEAPMTELQARIARGLKASLAERRRRIAAGEAEEDHSVAFGRHGHGPITIFTTDSDDDDYPYAWWEARLT